MSELNLEAEPERKRQVRKRTFGGRLKRFAVLLILAVMALPLVLDHLTPKGRVPANDAEMPSGGLQGGLGGILGRALGGLGGGSASGQGGSSAGDIVGGLLRSVLGGQRGA